MEFLLSVPLIISADHSPKRSNPSAGERRLEIPPFDGGLQLKQALAGDFDRILLIAGFLGGGGRWSELERFRQQSFRNFPTLATGHKFRHQKKNFDWFWKTRPSRFEWFQ